jgi:hypothetical protein
MEESSIAAEAIIQMSVAGISLSGTDQNSTTFLIKKAMLSIVHESVIL